MKQIKAYEFVRRLRVLTNNPDYKFSIFLGAGCSVSSGIPTAGNLVENWLPRLKKLETGKDGDLNNWLIKQFPDYNKDNAEKYYGDVIERMFHTSKERQKEIEKLVEGKSPAFGYSVLATLMSHSIYGKHFNIVLTTNFDDLITDALYLYTNKKPLVIYHESLIGFVRTSRTQPLIIKLHGDARLSPKNIEAEIKNLDENVKKVLKNLFMKIGLIFIGYGGKDASIANILNDLPKDSLPWGVFWIGNKIPETPIGEWLKNNDAIWVEHQDFDELMLLILKEFDLKHPDKEEFNRGLNFYIQTFKSLEDKIQEKLEGTEKSIFEEAFHKALLALRTNWSEFKDMKKIIRRNDQVLKKDFPKIPKVSEEIDDIFEVINNMPNYGISLIEKFKCFNKLFQSFKTLLDDNVGINTENLEQYTNLLCVLYGQINLFSDLAPFSYKLSEKPADMINYALFNSLIKNVNEKFIKTMNRGEEEYKNLIKDNPDNALTYFYYAIFLKNVRKDFIKANDYFNKALILCPDNSKILCGYSGFLLSQGKHKEGFAMLDKIADSSDLNDQILLESSFYTYCHTVNKSVFFESITVIIELIKSGTRLLGHNLADNIEKAINDDHLNPDFLEILSKVIVDEAKIEELNNYDYWK